MALDSRLSALITAIGADIKTALTSYVKNTNGGAEKVGSALATSGAVSVNLNNGSIFPISPSAAVTSLAFTNVPASGLSASVRICATNGATAYLLPLPTGGIWYGGAVPVPTPSKKTIYDYFTTDGGSSWHCSAVNQV